MTEASLSPYVRDRVLAEAVALGGDFPIRSYSERWGFPLTAGVPAAWAAEPMAGAIRSSGDEPPPVWPYAHGEVRGQAFEPLHIAAPEAAEGWPQLSEILAVLDCLRARDLRIRKPAEDFLSRMLPELAVGNA